MGEAYLFCAWQHRRSVFAVFAAGERSEDNGAARA